MKDIQTVFQSIQDKKHELKSLRKVYKDALHNNQQYVDISDKLTDLKELKKSLETEIREEMGSDYVRIEELKEAIKIDQEMMSDIALTKMMSGEPVEFVDKDEVEYEPIFSVRFKKM